MANILVLAPHADDEILGCGGTMAKHIRQGDNVYVAVMTNASEGAPELFSPDFIQALREECKGAHCQLGVKETFFEELPAPQLEQYPQYKIATVISRLIKTVQPTHLYIPHKGDLHLDHGAIYNAALVAARPLPGQVVRHIFAYETLSETEWGHPTPEMAFVPNKFVDISGSCVESKLSAMNFFASQLKDFPNPRSIDGIKALSAFRGASIGVDAAEAFMVIRTVE